MEGGSVSRLVLGFRMVDREVVDWGREVEEQNICYCNTQANSASGNMEDRSSHVSSSFFSSKMPQFGVDNETDEISSSERQRKRKRYERSKGYMEKIKKTCEKIAEIEGALLEERDEAQQKRDVKIAFKLNHLKEAQKKRDGKIAFKLKCLKKALERLRAGTTRSEEKRGLMLSVHRQQLNPQSFTLQIATEKQLILRLEESVFAATNASSRFSKSDVSENVTRLFLPLHDSGNEIPKHTQTHVCLSLPLEKEGWLDSVKTPWIVIFSL
ncbi:hypothetical protein V6N11_061212 [Hibiscus sabdariffa]|uniref:Uncharacterized protein n=1 Tax=Hibiscus sabdariffa TaxID=183260 RepID=A0ABR2NUV6_9ROSI